MNQHNARPLTLYDLIARRWDTGAPVAALRFGATTAAFAGADGALRIRLVLTLESDGTAADLKVSEVELVT